jgi:hypothetical protein
MLKPLFFILAIKENSENQQNALVAVNETGIWRTLDGYVYVVILKRPETSLLLKPVLLIIDLYGPHKKLADSKNMKNRIFLSRSFLRS